MASPSRRIAILAEGQFVPFEAKTAIGLLRYRPEDVVAVVDSRRAGATAQECVGTGGATPVVAGVDAAHAMGANTLVIGIAPAGGQLPKAWRPILEAALDRGWRVVSGMHSFLGDDPELATRAAAHGGALEDVRRPPRNIRIGLKRAAQLDALVVLTVGTDCNVGKMTASLEVQRALNERGVPTAFVASGQTGILARSRELGAPCPACRGGAQHVGHGGGAGARGVRCRSALTAGSRHRPDSLWTRCDRRGVADVARRARRGPALLKRGR